MQPPNLSMALDDHIPLRRSYSAMCLCEAFNCLIIFGGAKQDTKPELFYFYNLGELLFDQNCTYQKILVLALDSLLQDFPKTSFCLDILWLVLEQMYISLVDLIATQKRPMLFAKSI